MAKADFLTGLVLVLLSLYVIYESWQMPRLEHLKIHPLSVPGLVPAFLATIILIFATVLIIRSVLRGGHHIKLTWMGFLQTLKSTANQRLLLTAILTMGYAVFLIGTLPYWLATGIFIFVFITLFEWERGMSLNRWRKVVISGLLIAILSSAAITWIFDRLFLVALP